MRYGEINMDSGVVPGEDEVLGISERIGGTGGGRDPPVDEAVAVLEVVSRGCAGAQSGIVHIEALRLSPRRVSYIDEVIRISGHVHAEDMAGSRIPVHGDDAVADFPVIRDGLVYGDGGA